MSTGFIVLTVIVAVLLLSFIGIYNGLVARKNQVEYADGAINTMFKNRFDLIPNLVEMVKQYMQHEKGLLEKLTELRSGGKEHWEAGDMNEWDQKFGQTMKAFKVSVENYPDLKAGTQFSKLQDSLNECEAQLAAARRTYNAAVMDYNNGLEQFPSNLIAGIMGYKRKTMIDASQEERKNVNVKELFAS
ncbi:MAG: LemA family protein [Bacteroidales bacterium]|jgi:LemA protein|nr:LemA family protein [Bacteroidales bacterium]